jgi:glycosyltransferase involved in cell wall biosynthesis
MTYICFVGPFKPIMCGIADYTGFLTDQMPRGSWGILSFDPQTYGRPLTNDEEVPRNHVWRGIVGRDDWSASVLQEGLTKLGHTPAGTVLWFQHDFGIWPDDTAFLSMLRSLSMPKVVTLHTLHFQSPETTVGLRKNEYDLLRGLLPIVDGITVFSHGVHNAVVSAFPRHREKVHVIPHGVHSYPRVAHMTRAQAKQSLHDFLVHQAPLAEEIKEILCKERVFLDPDTVALGQTGFLCPLKGSEMLCTMADRLQKATPSSRVASVRIGSPRDGNQEEYASNLQRHQNGTDRLLLNTWLSRTMLPVAQKAFDINFYWPRDCTQSGILAHAFGAGAVIVGKDMEGVGETLREAGAATATQLEPLAQQMKALALIPELTRRAEEKALEYASNLSWRNQARAHHVLAERTAWVHAKPRAYSVLQSIPLGVHPTPHTRQATIRPSPALGERVT